MKRLSNKIMDIQPLVEDEHMYLIGYNDAKHAAAGIAIDYDDVMAFLESALAEVVDYMESAENEADTKMLHIWGVCNSALEMARELDEHQKTEGME